jgi:hypothetical protein
LSSKTVSTRIICSISSAATMPPKSPKSASRPPPLASPRFLLQKLARADDPEAHLDNYSRLVELLCRLNRELSATQQMRDDSRRTLGREYDPVRVKDVEEINAIETERFYSDPPSDSTLAKPPVPPALPPIPTATFMAEQAREERQEAELRRLRHSAEMMKALKAKLSPASKQIQNTQAPAPNQIENSNPTEASR